MVWYKLEERDSMSDFDWTDEPLERVTIEPGGVIFLESQSADTAFVVLKGNVEVGRLGEHTKFVELKKMGPGELFGEIALLTDEGTRAATAMSSGGCELVSIPKAVFQDRLKVADPLFRFVVGHLCQIIVELNEKVVNADVDAEGMRA